MVERRNSNDRNELYLVTGGAGFIGSHIVERLVKENKRVRVLDNLSTGRLENIKPFLSSIDFIKGDLCDYDTAKKAVEDATFILHQAAVPSVPRSLEDPIRSNDSIVTASINLFVAAQKEGVQRVVQASSSSVYGDSPTLPKKETMQANPLSPYAVAKYSQELYGKVFSKLYDMSVVSLRYFNVFGPRQDPESEYAAVVAKFVSVMLRGECPTIYGDGETTRDFTFVDNVVEANLLACITDKPVDGEVINIACGESITIIELVNALNGLLGRRIAPKFAPGRRGDIRNSLADIEKARLLLHYKPKIPATEGLRTALKYASRKP